MLPFVGGGGVLSLKGYIGRLLQQLSPKRGTGWLRDFVSYLDWLFLPIFI